jgi:hypothetical protein
MGCHKLAGSVWAMRAWVHWNEEEEAETARAAEEKAADARTDTMRIERELERANEQNIMLSFCLKVERQGHRKILQRGCRIRQEARDVSQQV